MSGMTYQTVRFNNHGEVKGFSIPTTDLNPGDGIIWTTDGCLIRIYDCSFDNLDAAREMYEALSEAVELYGKPGGPWNVPGDPGSWIEKAKRALQKARGEG